MSHPWDGVVRSIQDELVRCSQRLEDHDILPDQISVDLPRGIFDRWAPVFQSVTTEIGEALVGWAARRGHGWHGGKGPRLEVRLADDAQVVVETWFSGC